MAAEFTIITEPGAHILLRGADSSVFSTVMTGEQTDEGYRVPFTQENALRIRRLLTGRTVEISKRDRAILAYLSDAKKKPLAWTLKLPDLIERPMEGKFGHVRNLWDLLHYLPLRFIDKSNPQRVDELELGKWGVIIGEIVNEVKYDRFTKSTKVVIEDVAGKRISAQFFRQQWLSNKFSLGDEVVLYGKYSEWVNHKGYHYPQIINASMDKLTDLQGTLPMIPVYPQKSGDKSSQLQRAIRKLLDSVVWFEDPVPDELLRRFELMGRNEAYRKLHFPENREDADRARERLAFDEYLRLQGFLVNRGAEVKGMAGRSKTNTAYAEDFRANLPFEFTGAQNRVIEELTRDLAGEHPMYRLLQGDVGQGKAQPLYSSVLVPEGFKPMGEMRVGDRVLTPDGGSSRVLGVFPQGTRPVYELTFRDGVKVRADEDHLWSVRTTTAKSRDRPHKLLTTRELLADLYLKNGYPKWYVDHPAATGLDNPWASSIDPYLLGALLGDGSLTATGVRFSVGEDGLDILSHMVKGLPSRLYWREADARTNATTGKKTFDYWLVKTRYELPALPSHDMNSLDQVPALHAQGYSLAALAKAYNVTPAALKKLSTYDFKAGHRMRNSHPVLEELRRLGLHGLNSYGKHVPSQLLVSDSSSRLALLQGLLDTDGSVVVGRGYGFTSVSKQLAEDVAFLVRSLGGHARLARRVRKSGLSWHVSGRLPEPIVPFRLARKRLQYEAMPVRVPASKAIIAIEYVGEEPTQCIKLEDPRGLYITDGFTVTHNTEAAIMAILTAIGSGYQVAYLAPTEVLASQLYDRLRRDIARANLTEKVNPAFLSGSMKAAERRRVLAGLADGSIHMVIGTHAILQKGVAFSDLGLVIIDESQKWGTRQRTLLRELNAENGVPDLLLMSATPLPRTTSQVVYGDMEISVLNEAPVGRKPIETHWVRKPDEAWDRIRKQVALGHQAYIVTSLVDDSETMENVESAISTYENMQYVFPEYTIGLLHGRMNAEEKEVAINDFYTGETDILVATTVVEVGVNVPNATVMTIMDANRFGIASLHQIRGRVGRGDAQSYCYLVGEASNGEAEERLNALVHSNDGFWLAEKDLEIRGEGALFGMQQSGRSTLFVGNLREHRHVLERARRVAKNAVKSPAFMAEVEYLYRDVSIDA